MKTQPRRTRISRWATISTREFVYQTPEGIEVDSSEQFELIRRRVLYEDVRLVTYHRERGFAFLFATGILTAFFIAIGVVISSIGGNDSWVAALIFFLIGLPALLAFMMRLIWGVDVITVFGRRSMAIIRIRLRKQRARELYGMICASARNAQRERPVTFPGSVAQPLPADVPLPPL
ncbi:MAG TPA: hypothetical protein VF608_12300 [Thermoanaerobaculia bacterium]